MNTSELDSKKGNESVFWSLKWTHLVVADKAGLPPDSSSLFLHLHISSEVVKEKTDQQTQKVTMFVINCI